jgi:hypothetical protein
MCFDCAVTRSVVRLLMDSFCRLLDLPHPPARRSIVARCARMAKSEHVRLALDAKGILPACDCRTIGPKSLAGNQSRDGILGGSRPVRMWYKNVDMHPAVPFKGPLSGGYPGFKRPRKIVLAVR